MTDIPRMNLGRSGMRSFANPVGPHIAALLMSRCHIIFNVSGTDSAFLLSIKLLCLSFFCSGFSLFPLKQFLISSVKYLS